jgi:hypothetical protein
VNPKSENAFGFKAETSSSHR